MPFGLAYGLRLVNMLKVMSLYKSRDDARWLMYITTNRLHRVIRNMAAELASRSKEIFDDFEVDRNICFSQIFIVP